MAARAVVAAAGRPQPAALPERVADTVRTMGFGTMGHAGAWPPARPRCWATVPTSSTCAPASVPRSGAAWRPPWAPASTGAVLGVLEVTYTGALLSAGMGHLRFEAVPALMGEATALMTGTAP